jgi:hypothetical protein
MFHMNKHMFFQHFYFCFNSHNDALKLCYLKLGFIF